jgi:hypothetical protein
LIGIPLLSVIISGVKALISSPIIITVISDYFFRPHIIFEIIPNFNNDGRKSIIELQNDGGKHATNISLVVFTPKKLVSKDLFSTKTIFLPEFKKSIKTQEFFNLTSEKNQTSIILELSRLEYGKGSLTKIELTNDGNKSSNYYNYSGFATYDQGSTTAFVIKPATFDEILSKLEEIYTNPGTFLSLFLLMLIGFPVMFTFIFKQVRRRTRERNKKQEQIIEDLINIRKNLKSQENNNSKINEQWLEIDYLEKKEIFSDIEQLLSLDDVYILIQKRNNSINRVTENEIKQFNEKCIQLIDRALKIIDNSNKK